MDDELNDKTEEIRDFFKNLTPKQKEDAANFAKSFAQATADALNRLPEVDIEEVVEEKQEERL